MTRTRATGWQVTLTHPDTGRKTEPDLADDPEFRANPRGLPEARVPVAQTPEWARDWGGSEMRLTEDGVPAPIDELDRVEVEQGQTILVGVGGVELRTVAAEQFTFEQSHVAAEQVIQNNTSYTANVDTPDRAQLENVIVQDPDTTVELDNLLLRSDTDPLEVTNGTVRQYQSAWVNADDTRLQTTGNGFVAGVASRLPQPGEDSHDVTVDVSYTIPESRVAVYARGRRDGGQLSVEGRLAGTSVTTDELPPDSIGWFQLTNYTGGDLTPGTYDFSINYLTEIDSGAEAVIDAVAVVDSEFSYNFDNSLDEPAGDLDGPENYPTVAAEFDDHLEAFSVTGGKVEATTSDGSTLGEVALSNDSGGSYPITASNANSVEGDFSQASPTLRTRLTLTPQGGPRDATPRFGFEPQAIDAYDLFADVDRTPNIIDYSDEKRVVDILSDIAGEQFLWEVRRAPDGTTSIEFAEPEQRVADDTPQLTDLTVQKDTELINEVTVKGGNARVSDEQFTASQSYVSLSRDNIVPQTESVRDPDTGTRFTRRGDYEIDWRAGEIRITSDSDMTSGETYVIDYQSEVRGTVEDTTVAGEAEVVSVPGIATDRAAEQLAQFLVDEFSVPRWRATARIPPQTGVFSAIDAINVGLADELPDGAFPLSPRNVEDTPEGLVVQLGRTRDFASAVSELSGQLQSVSKRV